MLSVMLQEVRLQDFKSFADQTAYISPFTVLIGANASGKSNFVDALRFVHGLSQGWTVDESLNGHVVGGVQVWSGIRGGANAAVRATRDRFTVGSRWQIDGDGYRHSVEVDAVGVVRESVDNLFLATRPEPGQTSGDDLLVEWLAGSGKAASARAPTSSSVLGTPPARANIWTGSLRGTMADLRFLDLQPSRMRDYAARKAPNESPRLATDGHNLSAVLWSLCRDQGAKDEVVDWLIELCAPEIRDIDFEETKSGDVMLWVTESDGTRVSAKSMSDGTLRLLGLLGALKTAGSGTTLVIEDLEHGLHPSRLQLLVDAVESVTDYRPETNRETAVVVATTHSPALVEAAMRRPANSIQLFARNSEATGSLIRDVRSLPDIDAVLKRRDFTYLVNTGWLERAV